MHFADRQRDTALHRRIQDLCGTIGVRNSEMTVILSATTRATNEKKMTKDLRQPYGAMFFDLDICVSDNPSTDARSAARMRGGNGGPEDAA
jgi:hypothetical protein